MQRAGRASSASMAHTASRAHAGDLAASVTCLTSVHASEAKTDGLWDVISNQDAIGLVRVRILAFLYQRPSSHRMPTWILGPPGTRRHAASPCHSSRCASRPTSRPRRPQAPCRRRGRLYARASHAAAPLRVRNPMALRLACVALCLQHSIGRRRRAVIIMPGATTPQVS